MLEGNSDRPELQVQHERMKGQEQENGFHCNITSAVLEMHTLGSALGHDEVPHRAGLNSTQQVLFLLFLALTQTQTSSKILTSPHLVFLVGHYPQRM